MVNFADKKVLVTGGAGFVGSHMVDKLLSLGSDVVVYDNLSTGQKEFIKDSINKIKFIEGDLLDFELLCKSMKSVDFVFHMAANADVKDNLKDPIKCLNQNTIATSNVLEAMRKNNVKALLLLLQEAFTGKLKFTRHRLTRLSLYKLLYMALQNWPAKDCCSHIPWL